MITTFCPDFANAAPSEAELLGVDQLYRTAEHWGEGLQGRAVQVMCDRGALRLTAFG